MKKLLLGAMMAAFVVTDTYAYDKDNVLEESVYNEQLRYFDVIKMRGKTLYVFVKAAGDKTTEKADGSKEIRQIEYASEELRDAAKDLLGTDKSDIDKKEYAKREDEVVKHIEQIVLCVKAIKLDNLRKNNDYASAFEDFRDAIVAAFKGSKFIPNDKIKQSIYSNLGKVILAIDDTLTSPEDRLKREQEAAEEAAKKAQKAAEDAKKAQEEADALKAAQQEEAARAAAGKATKQNTDKLIKSFSKKKRL